MSTSTHAQHPSGTSGRRLTELRAGDRGRLLSAELAASDLDLLHAIGLADRSSFRLCKAGNPWIVQVNGTRIGLSHEVARQLCVVEIQAADGAAR